MNTPDSILVDLSIGQSTADSIAGRLRVPTLVIEAMLKRHQADGLVATKPIADGTLTAWHLTYEGKQTVKTLKCAAGRKVPLMPAIQRS